MALLGLVGYLAIAGALTLAPASAARPAVAFLALAGTGFSAYLTYLELFEIDAICQWCVASAIVMGLLAVLAVTRLLRVDSDGIFRPCPRARPTRTTAAPPSCAPACAGSCAGASSRRRRPG